MVASRLRFGDYELDVHRYMLSRADQSVKLERIPMELLLFLVERKGELVTRDQIIEKLWGKDVFVDTDNGINTAIRKIRHALNDEIEKPRFIQTIPGKGYRFIAPITTVDSAEPTSQIVSERKPRAGRIDFGNFAFRYLAIVLAVIALVTASIWITKLRHVATPPLLPPIRSLAVLPLENVTGDPSLAPLRPSRS